MSFCLSNIAPNNVASSTTVAVAQVDHTDFEYFNSFPPGYRFRPTDEELVGDYLKKKIMNEALPRNKIVEVNVYQYNPETLAEIYHQYGETEWYYFTPRDRKYPNGNRPNRTAGDGYWKATGADKKIKVRDVIVGFRKALVFYIGKPPNGAKTEWIMHEYKVKSPTRCKRSANDMKLDDWVLCRIYKKDRKSTETQPQQEDCMAAGFPTLILDNGENKSTEMNGEYNNESKEMIGDYNGITDPTGYVSTYGNYMHQPVPNRFQEIPQINYHRASNFVSFDNQFQAPIYSAQPKVESAYVMPPSMLLQNETWGTTNLENSFMSPSMHLQNEAWGTTNWENSFMPPSMHLQTEAWGTTNLENSFMSPSMYLQTEACGTTNLENSFMSPSMHLQNEAWGRNKIGESSRALYSWVPPSMHFQNETQSTTNLENSFVPPSMCTTNLENSVVPPSMNLQNETVGSRNLKNSDTGKEWDFSDTGDVESLKDPDNILPNLPKKSSQ